MIVSPSFSYGSPKTPGHRERVPGGVQGVEDCHDRSFWLSVEKLGLDVGAGSVRTSPVEPSRSSALMSAVQASIAAQSRKSAAGRASRAAGMARTSRSPRPIGGADESHDPKSRCAARMQHRLQLVELAGSGRLQEVCTVFVLLLRSEGATAEQPDRQSLQLLAMPFGERRRLPEPVIDVGGAAKDNRAVAADVVDIPRWASLG